MDLDLFIMWGFTARNTQGRCSGLQPVEHWAAKRTTIDRKKFREKTKTENNPLALVNLTKPGLNKCYRPLNLYTVKCLWDNSFARFRLRTRTFAKKFVFLIKPKFSLYLCSLSYHRGLTSVCFQYHNSFHLFHYSYKGELTHPCETPSSVALAKKSTYSTRTQWSP